MADLKSFDPTRVLDGWQVPAPASVDLALALDSLRPTGSGGADRAEAPPVMVRPALDDVESVHALDGWRAPTQAPLDLDLKTLLRTGGARPDDAKKAWLKARGYEMSDLEDIEVAHRRAPPTPRPAVEPTIRLPQVPPPMRAVEAPVLDLHVAPPAAVETPVLDTPVGKQPPAPDPRLLTRWQPLAWTALARRVRGAATEVVQTPNGPLVQTHMPQWLCALWRPQGVDAPLLGRWPEFAALVGAETISGALHQLLAELPPRAKVWQTELEADWVLVGELVLHQDAGLRAIHAQALRDFIEAERSTSLALLNGGYAAKHHIVRRVRP